MRGEKKLFWGFLRTYWEFFVDGNWNKIKSSQNCFKIHQILPLNKAKFHVKSKIENLQPKSLEALTKLTNHELKTSNESSENSNHVMC